VFSGIEHATYLFRQEKQNTGHKLRTSEGTGKHSAYMQQTRKEERKAITD
jgi:hypothetical protein